MAIRGVGFATPWQTNARGPNNGAFGQFNEEFSGASSVVESPLYQGFLTEPAVGVAVETVSGVPPQFAGPHYYAQGPFPCGGFVTETEPPMATVAIEALPRPPIPQAQVLAPVPRPGGSYIRSISAGRVFNIAPAPQPVPALPPPMVQIPVQAASPPPIRSTRGLLARIDDVVSDMEHHLHPRRSPRRSPRRRNSSGERGRRRDEVRQRIEESDDSSERRLTDLDLRLDTGLERRSLEAERDRRAQELADLMSRVEDERRRADMAEEAATGDQTTYDAKALRHKVAEFELAAERDQRNLAQAQWLHRSTAEELQGLQDNSQKVLGDCRALQARLKELASERAVFGSARAEFDEERRELLSQIQRFDQHRAELETVHRNLVEERHGLTNQHAAVLLRHDEESLQKVAALQREERLLRQEVLETENRASVAEAGRRHAEEANKRRTNADSLHITELERELRDAREAETRGGGDRAKIVELERELSGLREGTRRSEHQRIAEMERELASLQAAEVHLRSTSIDRARLVELEQDLADIRAVEGASARKLNADRVRLTELERELAAESGNARDANASSIATSRQIRVLEADLFDARAAHGVAQKALANLEAQMEETEWAMKRREGLQLRELQTEVDDARAAHAATQKRMSTNGTNNRERSLKIELERLTEELEAAQNNRTLGQQRLAEVESLLEVRARNFKSREATKILDLEGQMHDIRSDHLAAQARLNELETLIDGQDRTVKKRKTLQVQSVNRMQMLESELSKEQQALERAERELREAREELDQMHLHTGTLTARAEELARTKENEFQEKLKRSGATVGHEHYDLEAQVESQSRELEEQKYAYQQVREELDVARGQLQDARSSLNSLETEQKEQWQIITRFQEESYSEYDDDPQIAALKRQLQEQRRELGTLESELHESAQSHERTLLEASDLMKKQDALSEELRKIEGYGVTETPAEWGQ
mmetsp:Transcript_49894/g.132560  ORF Transcript_49894/g.132560 Transcript_49894/m.132560 type:complete len:959 (-) Transcript_49894:197-3073(-)